MTVQSSFRNAPIDHLLAYYGDDFTGSTDVMESLSYGGIETVLFVEPPDQRLLDRYKNAQAIGIAGRSRAMNLSEMDNELNSAFSSLLLHNPRFLHYKTCSTFDSSPTIGSIGRAIEHGLTQTQNDICPLVVGAPALQRFCVFGNLFARSGLDSGLYRLDRHPTMMCHPVTPMDEADLRLHLSRQTTLPIELIDVLTLDEEDVVWQDHTNGRSILLFDTLQSAHLKTIGKTLQQMQSDADRPLFVAGSSGVEYALVDHWRSSGMIDHDFEWSRGGDRVEQIFVVSGSCSPVTERQIQQSLGNGFDEFALDTETLEDTDGVSAEVSRLTDLSVKSLRAGRSVVVHSCRGPEDPRLNRNCSTEAISECLASVALCVVANHSLRRVAVTGGDTSGVVARHLGINALEMLGPLAPGSPLCIARSHDPIDRRTRVYVQGWPSWKRWLLPVGIEWQAARPRMIW